jgi:hypothetical protein
MLDRDLAELYEFEILKSQIVTSSWGGTRKMPYAFKEYGVAMLSQDHLTSRQNQVFRTSTALS